MANPPAGAPTPPGETRVIKRSTLLSPRSFGRGAILLYDRRLDRAVKGFKAWRQALPHAIALTGGEGIKELERFPALMGRVAAMAAGLSRSELVILAAGGGSVGDLAGLVAALLKRGVRFVQLPSTWLAAVDSAHGGKSALNVGGLKNQVGAFHHPERVYLVRELLPCDRPQLAAQGLAELLKMACIAGEPWLGKVEASRLRGPALLWRFLPEAIEAKLAVVRRDPEERGGERQVLNLGHTLGHALEAHLGLSHGEAVAQGLFFALVWSRRAAGLSREGQDRLTRLLVERGGYEPRDSRVPRLDAKALARLLRGDKKAAGGGRVTFVFLRAPGKPLRRSVTIKAVVAEARRQGWIG